MFYKELCDLITSSLVLVLQKYQNVPNRQWLELGRWNFYRIPPLLVHSIICSEAMALYSVLQEPGRPGIKAILLFIVWPTWSFRIFRPFWTILDHIWPLWTILDHVGTFWTILDHVELFWTLLDHIGPYWAILDHFVLFWTILDHLGLLRTILEQVGPYWTILDHLWSLLIV